MKFVSSENLCKGMRLAKPIYNRNGVMLYDRGTKLTKQGINSILNFKLYGIYILEPIEPIPPMTEDDIEFERFQTMNVYGIRDTWELLLLDKSLVTLDKVATDIWKTYAKKEKKIEFAQSLRGEEDELYKHSLYVAILSALMSARLRLGEREQMNLIKTALLYAVGRSTGDVVKSDFKNLEDYYIQAGSKGSRMIVGSNFVTGDVKDIAVARYRLSTGNKTLEDTPVSVKILQAAQAYDYMTAMADAEEPMSDVAAVRNLLSNNRKYGVEIIAALVDSIKMLYPGVCVELTNGTAGLVIKGNEENVLRPIILLFESNQVIDLGDDEVFASVQIADILKNFDKRYKIDQKLIDEYIKKYAQM